MPLHQVDQNLSYENFTARCVSGELNFLWVQYFLCPFGLDHLSFTGSWLELSAGDCAAGTVVLSCTEILSD
jgi:hypothetical protein